MKKVLISAASLIFYFRSDIGPQGRRKSNCLVSWSKRACRTSRRAIAEAPVEGGVLCTTKYITVTRGDGGREE